MSDKKSYPSPYELNEALSYCRRTFLDKFAQTKGMFFFRATNGALGHFLTSFLYEDSDLESVRKNAYLNQVNTKLTGFIITSNETDFDPIRILEKTRTEHDGFDGMTLSSLTEKKNGEEVTYHGTMGYTLNKASRIQFLQKEPRTVKYRITKIREGAYQVYASSESSADANKFAHFFKHTISNETPLEAIRFATLTPSQTIRFFDDLSVAGMGDDWTFVQVNSLIFRKPDLASNDDAGSAAKATDLSGISRAILDGKNLRDHAFVKQSESDGYRFSAMTIEYNHKKEPYIIEIRAEFKLRPEVFEIVIEEYRKREQNNNGEEIETKAELSDKDEFTYTSDVWVKAKEIYDNLVSTEPVEKESVTA